MRRILLIIALPFLIHCSEKAEATPPEDFPKANKELPADACTLITRERLASIVGALKDPPTPGVGLRGEKECRSTTMDGSWTTIRVYGGGEDRWDWEKGLSETQSPRQVADLGDESFSIKRGTDGVVYARTGSMILEVSCSCERSTAEALARAVMEAL